MVGAHMKFKITFALLALAAGTASAQRYAIVTDTNGASTLTYTNTFYTGVETLEGRSNQQWVVLKNFFTTQKQGREAVTLPTNYTQFRARALSVAAGNAYTHLPAAYGNIHTIAGRGLVPPGTNAWRPEYEGTNATDVYLSRPRGAQADTAGNIYIVEEDGHAVDKITPDGKIQTFIGQHVQGDDDDTASNGTSTLLNKPTGLWINGTAVYVLDAGNGRVRVLDDTAFIRTVFRESGPITNAGGLWVAPDGSEIFYTAGTELRRWRSDTGPTVFANNFLHLASVTKNPFDQIIVVDRGDNRVLRVRNNGSHSESDVLAGNGLLRSFQQGGKARSVSLPGASSVWFPPIGGYFVGLNEGARVWYVDDSKNAAPIIAGGPGVHAGDGKWFRSAGKKIGEVESFVLTPSGDMLITEATGYVRKIDFLRRRP